jgi:hypothetical protein
LARYSKTVVLQKRQAKTQLLALLGVINSDSEHRPFGLKSTDREEKLVMDIVNELENSPSNLAQQMPSRTETNLTGCLASFFV